MFNGNFSSYYYPETDSTNLQASALLAEKQEDEYFVVRAGYQSRGRGQGKNSWESPRDENLLCSYVLYPGFLDIDRWFYLSKITSLAIFDLLQKNFKNVHIKWPNDILVNGKKIAGILIENSLQNRVILNSVAGIGLNVNQEVFPDYPIPATSMKKESAKEYSIGQLFGALSDNIAYRYRQLQEEEYEHIDRSYLEHLYRIHETSRYKAHGVEFEARVIGVKDDGRLMLDAGGKNLLLYGFKEVEFL